jgi:hypothetical protein
MEIPGPAKRSTRANGATLRWAPLNLRAPFAFYPEQTFIQKSRNLLKTNEKTFSNRNRFTLFRIPQPYPVKLVPHAPARATIAALGRAGFQSRREGHNVSGALAPEATVLICCMGACEFAPRGQEFLMRES